MKIGILAAMPEEMQALKERERGFSDMGFVLRVSGVGKVNAAVATCELINVDHVSAIVVIGTCGALTKSIPVGRIANIKTAIYHDMHAEALGVGPGQIPFSRIKSAPWESDMVVRTSINQALRAAGETNWEERIASGDRFVAIKEDDGRHIVETFQAKLVDMETAAVAHTCALLGIPWGAVRIVSDNADHQAAESFSKFVRKSSYVLANIMQKLQLGDFLRASSSADPSHGMAHTRRQFSDVPPQNDTAVGKRGG